ncbi:DUF3558 domain-containing protein [Amycolatopsis orientalis]|uniref:DUF3558 domain-containing protein n=1 Tax=Amycolatopsis orientalis TaxID=31958 RepID=UPI0009DFCB69|nr:DUF3558 domain-containing protein [Amycolatopsis orientalis]
MRRTTLILSAAAFALAACSTPTNGTPTPTNGGSSPSSSTSPSLPPGVPKVNHPIDVTRFKQDPCKALTKAQVEELLGSSDTETVPRPDGEAGPACRWSIPSTAEPRINVIFGNSPDGGTASVYAAKGNAYKLVEPLAPIDGYPVTAYGVIDRRAEGACSVSLGISDTETVGIAATQSAANVGKKDPCNAAREGAIRVLATIRGGN